MSKVTRLTEFLSLLSIDSRATYSEVRSGSLQVLLSIRFIVVNSERKRVLYISSFVNTRRRGNMTYKVRAYSTGNLKILLDTLKSFVSDSVYLSGIYIESVVNPWLPFILHHRHQFRCVDSHNQTINYLWMKDQTFSIRVNI